MAAKFGTFQTLWTSSDGLDFFVCSLAVAIVSGHAQKVFEKVFKY